MSETSKREFEVGIIIRIKGDRCIQSAFYSGVLDGVIDAPVAFISNTVIAMNRISPEKIDYGRFADEYLDTLRKQSGILDDIESTIRKAQGEPQYKAVST